MKHYLNPETEEVFAYELDGSQDHLIPDNYVILSDNDLQTSLKILEDKFKNEELEKFNKLSNIEKRQRSYPNFLDYVDAIVKGDQVQLQKYIDDCLAVKSKYPKQ